MFTVVTDYLHHSFPKLPGGSLTLCAIASTLLTLWLLHKRTRWGGWLALFVNIATYSIPFLIEYHR